MPLVERHLHGRAQAIARRFTAVSNTASRVRRTPVSRRGGVRLLFRLRGCVSRGLCVRAHGVRLHARSGGLAEPPVQAHQREVDGAWAQAAMLADLLRQVASLARLTERTRVAREFWGSCALGISMHGFSAEVGGFEEAREVC